MVDRSIAAEAETLLFEIEYHLNAEVRGGKLGPCLALADDELDVVGKVERALTLGGRGERTDIGHGLVRKGLDLEPCALGYIAADLHDDAVVDADLKELLLEAGRYFGLLRGLFPGLLSGGLRRL